MAAYQIPPHELQRQVLKWEQARHLERNAYWASLKLAKSDYDDLVKDAACQFDVGTLESFYYYLQHNYGLKPGMQDGKLNGGYEITDAKKFLLYKIKYWQ